MKYLILLLVLVGCRDSEPKFRKGELVYYPVHKFYELVCTKGIGRVDVVFSYEFKKDYIVWDAECSQDFRVEEQDLRLVPK